MKSLYSALACLTLAVPAGAAHPLKVEDVQKLSRIGSAQVSPDGKWVAFTVTRSDVAKNKMVTNLWMLPAAGGTPQQLTFSEKGSNGQPRWSPDSRFLYFVSTRTDNKPQVFRLPVAGGESSQVSTATTGIEAYYLSPDGGTIAFVSTVYPDCSDLPCSEKKAKEKEEDPVKAEIITEIPFRRWDSWVEGKRRHIFVMSAEGGAAKDITPGKDDSPIWTESGSDEVAFSPDGREVCFSRYTENEALTGNSDLFTIPVTGGTPKQITTNKAGDATPLYSPDSRYIAYSATLRPGQESDQTRLFAYDRTTGEVKNLFEAVDRSIGSYVWAPDSKSLYVIFEDQGQSTLARLDLATLKVTRLHNEGTCDELSLSRDGSFLVYSNSDFSHPAELFRFNLGPKAPAPVQPLTHLNADSLKEIELGAYSSFSFPGWNGEAVQSWQLKPPGFDASRKYPLLLLMHGGPENAFDNNFHYRWNAQLFAAAGYVVILPNFHGSSGFGLKFMDSIKGQWGGAPYEDQMKAVDVALTWPYIDKSRLAAAGASYGGYMANWVEGHTDRFRAIVSHDGLFDLLGSVYSSDFVGGTDKEFKGTPWKDEQALIDQAPITYAKNFRTPMLVVHGDKDYRVDPSQGLAMFQVLQAMHVPSKLLYFRDENHWVLKPADSILWYHTVLDWLKEWVTPDETEYRKKLGKS
jgi:dipeptidyl aminopeptidase/acylaminoacyl peptidase